jgi:hypothetical protein
MVVRAKQLPFPFPQLQFEKQQKSGDRCVESLSHTSNSQPQV